MLKNFEYLDSVQLRPLYQSSQNSRRMKFYIEGIKCSKCIAKIEGLKLVNDEIQNLEVDLSNQTAFVELRSPSCSFAQVASSISNLGFRPIPIQPQEDLEENWRLESRRDLIRLGVAGFCAGNIMMFAFAIYFGVSGSLKIYFELVQFLLYLPVVTYVAWPFYKGFISGLRQKSMSIDGPMAIASFTGFLVSAWNMSRGTGSIYLDSTSGFLFLILSTRYFQKRTRFKFLKYLKPSQLAESFKARRKKSTTFEWVRADQLHIDDVILIEKDEWVPADGLLISPEATVDLSVLNGESLPRRLQRGASINAGAKLLTNSVEVKVLRSGAESLLARLLSAVGSPLISETEASRLSNVASQILLITVLSIALAIFVFGLFGNFEAQFEKAFALIVLACPCAMAFGTPLAFSFSMKRAQENGFVIKSAKTFEALSSIKDIFFDKTGTLTEKNWSIAESSLLRPHLQYQQIILLLESRSQHPIAFALRESWPDVQLPDDLYLESMREIPHIGVLGKINGEYFSFRSFVENSEKWFGLFKDDNLLWKFKLKARLQKGIKEAASELKKMGKNLHLLSGDSRQATEEVAQEIEISPQNIHSQLTPEMKAELIKANPNSIMVGDGVNDTLALREAKVGIAVRGGVDVALKSADILLLKDNLDSLPELFRIAKQARQQIRRNLFVALTYNLLGGTAAILGWVNPFVAALLMPMSSLFILATTWWGTRK